MTRSLGGDLEKLRARLREDGLVDYTLALGGEEADLAGAIGATVRLVFSGEIHCRYCHRRTSKSFGQGYCYACFRRLARCDACIMAPEKCHYRQGTCREPDWASGHCLVPHVVYLANSSGLKVGITRLSELPTRWIDQGAVQGLPLYRVTERRLAGLIEALLRQWVADRTQWQRMLRGEPAILDMPAEALRLKALAAAQVTTVLAAEAVGPDGARGTEMGAVDLLPLETRLRYPVLTYPDKIKSLNPEKTPRMEGTLLGVKGQYLILDTGCLNVRNCTAYRATVTLGA